VSVLVRASERSTERHCHTIVPYHSFNTNNNDDDETDDRASHINQNHRGQKGSAITAWVYSLE